MQGRLSFERAEQKTGLYASLDPMLALTQPPHDILFQRLARHGPLSETDRAAIGDLSLVVRTFPAQKTIVYEDDPSPACCLVLEGVVCCYQMLDEGRRAILSLHVPGDIPDLQSLHLPDSDFGMATLSTTTIASVRHADVRKLSAASPAIAASLWKEVLVMGAIYRAWIAGLARRDARGRLAHLFCELFMRLEAVGLTEGRVFPMPLRQTELADILGLTNVHVNRVITEMRAVGLIRVADRRVEICDWRELCKIADFDPRYMHLNDV